VLVLPSILEVRYLLQSLLEMHCVAFLRMLFSSANFFFLFLVYRATYEAFNLSTCQPMNLSTYQPIKLLSYEAFIPSICCYRLSSFRIAMPTTHQYFSWFLSRPLSQQSFSKPCSRLVSLTFLEKLYVRLGRSKSRALLFPVVQGMIEVSWCLI
jgi:hypothetical protein